MGFDTNWDIEKYKSPFESEEHWELRKNFLLAHKDKYPEDQLICLAQVFFNVELLGCRYPKKTMTLVNELSEGIADSFREKKQTKLQRTFVKASDAAGAKIKGLSSTTMCQLPSESNTSEKSIIKHTQFLKTDCKSQTFPNSEQFLNSNGNSCTENKCADIEQEYKTRDFLDIDLQPTTSQSYDSNLCSFQVFDIDFLKPYSNDLIIIKTMHENFHDDSISIACRSLKNVNLGIEYKFFRCDDKNEKWECHIRINNNLVARSMAPNKTMSKKVALEAFLKALQNICYTLEEKVKFLTDGSTIDKNVESKEEICKFNENSVGNKIMRSMGWKGGGLGKNEQGISEPIKVQKRIERSGFGVNITQKNLLRKVEQRLRTYAKSNTKYDLQFSSDFTKEERSQFHSLALSFDLKSKSYGSGADRKLVVSKKAVSKNLIVQNLKRCGGEDERYSLIEPFSISRKKQRLVSQ